MKLLHIVAGLPLEGGISQSVPELCRHLVSADVAVTLVSTGRAGEISEAALQAQEHGVELVVCQPSWPAQLYFSIEMLRKLPALIKAADVVHVHSQWTFPVWWGCHLALKCKKPLIMTPRGCLAPERLRISKFKKRIAGCLFDRRYLRNASVIHATCEQEAVDIRAYLESSKVLKCESSKAEDVSEESFSRKGAKAQRKVGASSLTNELTNSRTNELPPIVVVSNGVDLETFDSVALDRELIDLKWAECKGKHIALFLSRIHPLKGIESLIAAWCDLCKPSTFNLQPSTLAFSSDWILLIAGSGDEKYVEPLKQQVVNMGLSEHIKFLGPVFGDKKVKLMKAAEIFVLPTKNENFGIVVAEALACGVPVITTKGAPWQELRGNSASSKTLTCENSKVCVEKCESAKVVNTPDGAGLKVAAENSSLISYPSSLAVSGRCGWWIDHGVKPLAEALGEAMALSDAERQTMGQNGRRLVESKYQWSAVAAQMLAIYAAIETTE